MTKFFKKYKYNLPNVDLLIANHVILFAQCITSASVQMGLSKIYKYNNRI